ncbi:MAG: xylulokinase [Defluviitaleaceae bacterium]|nr:xylulokinase [Defluviitaleaceae bacterium]
MYLLGVDIGTSSCKTTVFDHTGNVIASASRNYPVYHPFPGWAEQKPTLWWDGFCGAVGEVLAKVRASDIAAIGVAGQGWSAVAVDGAGEVLFDNPIWMDNRAEEACAEITRCVTPEEVFRLCGNPVAPMYTTPKILWFQKEYPDAFNRVYKILQSNSYMVYKLTGEFSQDLSQGYGLHFFDMHSGEWNRDMAKEMGVNPDLMPDLCSPSKTVGGITKAAAEATGLLTGTPVVAGGLDAACSTLGAGVTEPGQTQAQGGTAGGMSLCLDNYVAHPKLIMGRHVIENRWLLQGGTVGGGGTLGWLKENILGLGYEEMSGLASTSPLGAGGLIFLPYLNGERSPIWDKTAQGAFLGLDYSKGKKDMVRSVMEGVAFSLMHNMETAFESGVEASAFNLVGGIANSPVWLQIIADVTGKPINIPSSDTGTNLGAAILAGIGVGIYADAQDAVKKTVVIEKEITANPENHEKYQQYYKLYRKLYEQTKETMRELAEMRDDK